MQSTKWSVLSPHLKKSRYNEIAVLIIHFLKVKLMCLHLRKHDFWIYQPQAFQ